VGISLDILMQAPGFNVALLGNRCLRRNLRWFESPTRHFRRQSHIERHDKRLSAAYPWHSAYTESLFKSVSKRKIRFRVKTRTRRPYAKYNTAEKSNGEWPAGQASKRMLVAEYNNDQKKSLPKPAHNPV
jgi:hypothetical protein